MFGSIHNGRIVVHICCISLGGESKTKHYPIGRPSFEEREKLRIKFLRDKEALLKISEYPHEYNKNNNEWICLSQNKTEYTCSNVAGRVVATLPFEGSIFIFSDVLDSHIFDVLISRIEYF